MVKECMEGKPGGDSFLPTEQLIERTPKGHRVENADPLVFAHPRFPLGRQTRAEFPEPKAQGNGNLELGSET
jgi:hypothetical protein